MDSGAPNSGQDGVLQTNTSHCLRIDQPSTLEGSTDLCMFLYQQNAVTMLAEPPREISSDGSCTDDDDVILGNNVITPRTPSTTIFPFA